MSVQEASQQPTLPSSIKLEAKPKPEIPPKPPAQSCPPSPEDGGSTKNFSPGKVKSIVNKFSKQDSDLEEQPTNGTAEPTQSKCTKSPPRVMPKPSRTSLQLYIGLESAPPLPVKKRGTLTKQKECVQKDDGESISVSGGRSGN